MSESCPHYTLEGHTPVRAHDFLAWVQWYADADRHVAHDYGETWELSTVFLGMAVRHTPLFGDETALPELFETALFRAGNDARVLKRYRTWEQAVSGHVLYLTLAREGWPVLRRATEESS